MKRYHSPKHLLRFLALTTLLGMLIMIVFAGSVFAEEGSDSITDCEIPEEADVLISRQNNDVILDWDDNGSDFYEVHATQDDYYFEPNILSYQRTMGSQSQYKVIFGNELGDPDWNSAYGIVSVIEDGICEEKTTNRTGSFNFVLVPGN